MRSTSKRDRALAAAVRRLDEAHRYIVAAIGYDDELEHVDQIGGLELAYAADAASRAPASAARRITDGQERARLRRRDYDRQVAAETAGGAT